MAVVERVINSNTMTTNQTNDSLRSDLLTSRGYLVADSMLLLFSLLLLFLYIFLIIITIQTKEMLKMLKVIIINLICGGICIIIAEILTATATMTSATLNLPVPPIACQVTFALDVLGSSLRVGFMVKLSIAVFILVKFGSRGSKMSIILSTTVAIWIIGLAFVCLNSAMFRATESSSGDIWCNFQKALNFQVFPATFLFTIFIAFLLSLILPLVTLKNITKNSATEAIDIKKALAKFTLCLLIGNLFSIATISVWPLRNLAEILSPTDFSISASIISRYILVFALAVSLIPMPIFLVVLFKPIRETISKIWKKFIYHFKTKRIGQSELEEINRDTTTT